MSAVGVGSANNYHINLNLTKNDTKLYKNTTLTPEQLFAKEHLGHEEMHFKMLLFFIFALITSQCALLYWKQKHIKSYRVLIFVILLFFSLLLL